MTKAASGHPEAELLNEMQALRREARATRHAYWFPLVLFGVLSCASIPFYIIEAPPSEIATTAQSGPVLRYFSGAPDMAGGGGYYWVAALVAGLLATQLWYRWHARRVGLQTRSLAFLVVTLVLIAATVSVPLIWHMDPLPGDLVIRGTFPFVLIAAGLLVLAWVERSWILGGIAAVYTAAAMLASLYNVENLTHRLGWLPAPGYDMIPNILLPAMVLLLAGASTVVVRRLRGNPA